MVMFYIAQESQDGPSTMDPQLTGSASLMAVISALVPTLITGLLFVGIFVLIRHRFSILYAPRTFLGTVEQKDRTPIPNKGYLNWLFATRNLPDEFLLYHESLDAYLYLRFLRTIIFICVVGCGLTWPILMPVNAAGGGLSTELDRISISNVKKTDHLYAHAVIACVFLGFVMVTIARERLWLISLRQAWALSTTNANRLSSRTVLFLSAPRDTLEQSNIRHYFGESAVRIWSVTKLEALQTLVSEQRILVEKLESEEAAVIVKANSWWARSRIDGFKIREMSIYDLVDIVKSVMRLRPMPTLSLFNKKINAIKSLREQIREKGELIEEIRRTYDLGEPHETAAVFVEFKTQLEAQRAYREVASPDLLGLTPRHIDVKPSEVIWDNLTVPPTRRIAREGIALSLVASTIVAWSIPSGLVGLVSNIGYLAENVEWLWFLKELPDVVTGLLSGLLAPLLTSALTKDIPALYRNIFASAGVPTHVINELKVQKWFCIFQVTQVFLVTAVFSGAATMASAVTTHMQDPNSILELLATQLPKSSNYYLTYFIVQGITSAADNLLNSSDLLQHLSFEYWKDETPRQKFNRYTNMKGIAWGQVYPKFANFAIIAIVYSCVAPLVLGFAAVGLSLYYCSYRYNLFYVIQPKIDTKGQAYTAALLHLLTGVYISELVLIGFFSMSTAKGPMIIAGLLFIVTVLYHVVTNRYISPLESAQPAELTFPVEKSDETTPLLSSLENGPGSHAQQQGPSALALLHTEKRAFKLMARLFGTHARNSGDYTRPLMRDTDDGQVGEEDVGEYAEEDLKRAYLHPALTARTPVVWMARDCMGTSRIEVRDTEAYGLKASDEGAWLDQKRRVQFSVSELDKVPVWRPAAKY